MSPSAVREPEPDPCDMTREALRGYLDTHHTVSLWPFCGRALGSSRSSTYQLAHEGTIKVLRLGHRCRVTTSWLESVLFVAGDCHD